MSSSTIAIAAGRTRGESVITGISLSQPILSREFLKKRSSPHKRQRPLLVGPPAGSISQWCWHRFCASSVVFSSNKWFVFTMFSHYTSVSSTTLHCNCLTFGRSMGEWRLFSKSCSRQPSHNNYYVNQAEKVPRQGENEGFQGERLGIVDQLTVYWVHLPNVLIQAPQRYPLYLAIALKGRELIYYG